MKCAVIIPVGPGHEYLAEDSIESVQEAFAKDRGPFSALKVIRIDDTRGLLGRSAARNKGVADAQSEGADWVFFLDADDLMDRGAFGVMTGYHADHDAVWGLICELSWDEESFNARPGQLSTIEHIEQVLANDPILTLQMGHFVRTTVAAATPFDVDLNCGEDFDYYLRVWSQFRCRKVATPLFINRRGFHSTGPRSATGRQWWEAVQSIISKRCRTANLLCEFKCEGEFFRFRIVDPFDPIQRHLLQGTFFELAELRRVRDTLKKGAAIVDIGANIGSHAVYLSRFLEPDRILMLDRNAELFDVLDFNLHTNEVANARTSVMDLATGNGQGGRDSAVRETAGVGTGHITASQSGAIRSDKLDSIVQDRVDLIRIGVPGAELTVLAGGEATISRFRPHLLVTVSAAHTTAADQWCQAHGYRVVRQFDHENYVNLFLESRQRT